MTGFTLKFLVSDGIDFVGVDVPGFGAAGAEGVASRTVPGSGGRVAVPPAVFDAWLTGCDSGRLAELRR